MIGIIVGIAMAIGLAAFFYIMHLTDKFARESVKRKSLEKEKEDSYEIQKISKNVAALSDSDTDERMRKYIRDDK